MVLKGWRILLVVSLLGVLASCARENVEVPGTNLSPVATASFTSTLQAKHSGKCIDVPGGSTSRGTRLIQWRCHGETNQSFSFYPVTGQPDTFTVRNNATGLCLDIAQGTSVARDYLIQWPCHGETNQQFTLQESDSAGFFSLVANHSGQCVDVMRASTSDRAEMLAYKCHGEDNQLFKISAVSVQPQPEPASVKVVAAGDIACDPTADSAFNGGNGTATRCHMKATAQLAASLNPDAVLVLGDLQYNTAEYEEFLQSYDPSWGRLKSKTYPIPGNHEYDTAGAKGYYRYFGSRAGDPDKGYYSFDLGDWHIVALNTNTACSTVSCSSSSAQTRWLREDLATTDKKCVMAMMHHPRYSSGRHGGYSSVDALWETLAEGGADVVLTGHDHHYERFAPLDADGVKASDGTRQFIVGTGGKDVYDLRDVHSKSERRVGGQYGVLELELSGVGYAWSFIEEGGSSLDSGKAACH